MAQADLIDEAKSRAKNRQDLIGLADTVFAARSKGCSFRYGCQNPCLQ